MTKIPSGASCAAKSRVTAFSAAFEMAYAGVPAPMPLSEPAPLDTLTIRRPGPWWRINGRTAWDTFSAPSALTSKASRTTPTSAPAGSWSVS
nr:hypothetical protein [Micromonospora sp. 4G55]